MLKLALRNLRVHLSTRFAQVVMVAFTVALLFLGNSLLDNSRQGLARTFRQAFTGDFSVSSRSEDNFTLFGSDLPLIGEYVVIPALPRSELWKSVITQFSEQLEFLPQVSASGILLLPNQQRQAVPVFGVDAANYFHFFPSLVLETGTLTPNTAAALWINSHEFQALTRSLGHPPTLGEPFDLGMTVRGSFLIRTVYLEGIYRYPGGDPALDRTLLVDPNTARALNGYTANETAPQIIDPKASDLLHSDLDSLFSESNDQMAPAETGVDLNSTIDLLGQKTLREALNRPLEDTWNFVLMKSRKQEDDSWVLPLQGAFDQKGLNLQIRDWVGTAGGNALVVSLLQVLFSVGLGLVALVAALIVMNSLALAVVERTQEIGTWRALGASRAKVAMILCFETSILVFSSAGAGLVLASVVLGLVATQGIPISNPFLVSLLGGSQLKPSFSVGLWVGHLLFSVLLVLVACWLPVRRALAITPIQAMQRE